MGGEAVGILSGHLALASWVTVIRHSASFLVSFLESQVQKAEVVNFLLVSSRSSGLDHESWQGHPLLYFVPFPCFTLKSCSHSPVAAVGTAVCLRHGLGHGHVIQVVPGLLHASYPGFDSFISTPLLTPVCFSGCIFSHLHPPPFPRPCPSRSACKF